MVHHRHHHHNHNSGCTKRRHKANIPTSTSGAIVFPYDPVKRQFVLDNYNIDQTQGRAGREEIERFLNEVNIPMAKWFEEWSAKYEAAGWYSYFLYLSILIPPLFLCYALWLANAQNTAEDNLNYVQGQVRTLIYERNPEWAEKGLQWWMPGFWPQWLELRTGQGNPNVQISGKGIQTMSIPQKNYVRRQQPNHYNGGGMSMGGMGMSGGGDYEQQGYGINQQANYNSNYHNNQVAPVRQSGFS